MNKHISLVVICLLLSSCCGKGEELNRYLLTQDDKVFIPYEMNESVGFIHSKGFEFDLIVTSHVQEFRQTEMHHCWENYSTYEFKDVTLQSGIPELFIKLTLTPQEFYPVLEISINKHYFGINTLEEPQHDSLSLNGRTYFEVYSSEKINPDSTLIVPSKLLYTKAEGIIQIKMSNNEAFTIWN